MERAGLIMEKAWIENRAPITVRAKLVISGYNSGRIIRLGNFR